uniref:PB1-like domain-containing protein n=1 Tax=Daucus carota subsp. sativus TaxID=79200 RepID=A0A164VIM3_DAUCS
MAEKLLNVRYNYDGTFNKTSYSGGKSIIINRQDVDEFSYTVALENVKDCLNCTEIGGLYVLNGKPQQWKLLKCDSDLLQLVDACESGGDINIYVDCVVDKECKPLEPGVPFLVVRPRKNILKEHLQSNQNRRTFVSSHQLQQQRQSKRIPRSPQLQEVEQNKLPKSPRLQELAKKNLRSSTHLQEVQNNNLPKTPPKNLRSSTHLQEVQNTNLPKTPPKNLRNSTHLQESGRVNEYELRKIQNVEENKKKFKELRLGNYVANPIKPIVQQSTKEKKDRDDPEYVVENETGDESDDTSEGIKSVQKRKAIPGPRTRSRANDKDLGDKDPVDPIDKGKKVAAATEMRREDVGDTDLQNGSEGEEVEADFG